MLEGQGKDVVEWSLKSGITKTDRVGPNLTKLTLVKLAKLPRPAIGISVTALAYTRYSYAHPRIFEKEIA